MNPRARQSSAIIADFEQLLLRWNRQISLVSRQNTPGLVKELIEQSRSGCAQIQKYLREFYRDDLPGTKELDYFDLGSGGGMPGFIWHVLLKEGGWNPNSYLVEPRQKRSWFLGRLAGISGVDGLGVLEGSWPEAGAAHPATGKTVLVSLKALRMTDPLILKGLEADPAGPLRGVTICRFFSKGKTWTPELLKELQVVSAGCLETTTDSRILKGPWIGQGTAALPLPGEGGPDLGTLLVSSYRSIP